MPGLVSAVGNDMAQQLMERVKTLRLNLGMTQEQFAERAGLKYKHYQAVEAGRKLNIHFDTLIKMARACGLEPWQLLNFDARTDVLAESQAAYGTSKTAKKASPGSKPLSARANKTRR